jgi:Homeodomain-like domain
MGKEAKYIVRLTDEERHTLQQLVLGPRVARDKALRARMLLKAEVDGPHWSDGQIAAAFDVGVATIHRLRQRLVEEGLEAALTRQPPAARSHANSTARRKPVWWPSRAARRQRDARPGRCACWRRSWSNSRLWRPSGGKPCGKRSKK